MGKGRITKSRNETEPETESGFADLSRRHWKGFPSEISDQTPRVHERGSDRP